MTTDRIGLDKIEVPGDTGADLISKVNADLEIIDDHASYNKWDATRAPLTTDDETLGYVVGSFWIDVSADSVYICTDASTGAAAWQLIGGTGGNNYEATTDPTVNDDETAGYSIGSIWINTSVHKVFVCFDATEDEAIWEQYWPALVADIVGCGDVVGPAVAVDSNVAEFNTTTGKLIKDGALTHANVASAISLKHTADTDPSEIAGWVAAGETWTYASADTPTFTFTITGDKTAKYQAGMKIKLTQTTAKYFIITKVAYGSPNTTVTVYGGTDYTLANAAITSPYYSLVRVPFGFPMDHGKWSVTLEDTTTASQTNPTQNTYYNVGSLSLSCPIGVWWVEASLCSQVWRAADGSMDIVFALSTSSSSASDVRLKKYSFIGDGTNYISSIAMAGMITATSKTTYYLNVMTPTASMSGIAINGASGQETLIKLVCAYL